MKKRLISLDVFRGITITGMILVNNPGSWSHVYSPLLHSEWNGCTPTDLIFPFFIYIVGVAITLSLSKRKEETYSQKIIILNILRRSIILFSLGLFLHAFPYFNMSDLRIPGVLQRIAIVYFISSIIFLRFHLNTQISITLLILIAYWLIMTVIPVPGIGEANLGKTTNLAAWLDNLLLGGHLWSHTNVWDPEGILSTLPAVSTALLGILTGHWLQTKNSEIKKFGVMFIAGIISILIGIIWDVWFPINKSIWTSSYVLYTGGWALLLFSTCYYLIDIKRIQFWIKPFQVYGMNAITVYFLSSLISKLLYLIKVGDSFDKQQTIKHILYSQLLNIGLNDLNTSLLWAILYVSIWLGLMWVLYHKKIFIKV